MYKSIHNRLFNPQWLHGVCVNEVTKAMMATYCNRLYTWHLVFLGNKQVRWLLLLVRRHAAVVD